MLDWLCEKGLTEPTHFSLQSGFCTYLLLSHNHPSSRATSSVADIKETKRLRDAIHPLGIDLTDHIIFADGRAYSFAEERELPIEGPPVIRLILATTGTSTLDGLFDTGDVVFQVRKIMLTDTRNHACHAQGKWRFKSFLIMVVGLP